MSELSLLQKFQEAYQSTDLTPLVRDEQLQKFWVEYGREALEEVEQLIEDNAAEDAKVIFSGHTGSGKSTLLAKFGRKMSDRYFVVFFSIAETIEMSAVDHINILFAIGVRMLIEAEREQIKIHPSTQNGFYQWFAERTLIKENKQSMEGSSGFSLLKLISGKLKTESSIREVIKQEFERDISTLVAKLNEMAAEFQRVSRKKVLVIIDDLDKLDLGLVKNVFRDHVKSLFLPGFSIVFTVPISCLRDISLQTILKSEASDQIALIPVTKLFAKVERRKIDPTAEEDAVETLCQVLHKRIPAEILEPEIATQIVHYSGGVLRELIRISNRCCRICLRKIRRDPTRTDITIDADVLAEAIKALRLEFETTLGKADYTILQATHDKFMPEDPKEQPFLDLLHGLQVLEYQNGDMWYDLHPIVRDLMQRRGLINANG